MKKIVIIALILVFGMVGLAQAEQVKSALDPLALSNANQGLLDASYGYLIAQSGTLTMDTTSLENAYFDLVCVDTKTNGLVRVRANIITRPKWGLTNIKILK
jgi:glutaminase